MGTLDAVTWQALVAVLSVAGLVATGVVWRRRGAASGLRMLAITLLPAAAYLTGTLRLLWEVADAVVSWAVRFAFSPLVWAGIVLAGLAVVLLGVSGAMRRRGIGVGTPAVTDQKTPAVSSGRTPQATRRRGRQASAEGANGGTDGPNDPDDMDDIEAILRKHGIS